MCKYFSVIFRLQAIPWNRMELYELLAARKLIYFTPNVYQ